MLEDYTKELRYCNFCPKLCHFTCPVAKVEFRETVTAAAKMTLINLIREKNLEINQERADVIYRCLGCLICRNYCDHETEVPRVMAAARKLVVESGFESEAMMLALSCMVML